MKRIDVSEILEQKNPKLKRRLPQCFIRIIERIICVDKINFVLDNYSQLDPMSFIRATLDYIGTDYEVIGSENVPPKDQVVFASNHPLGGLDGMMLAHAIGTSMEGQKNVKLIVNDILMNLDPLKDIFVPVNKHGAQNAEYANNQIKTYQADYSIVTFPAGLCSRLHKGVIEDMDWKQSFVVKAGKNKRVIIPTFVTGLNSMLFYREALIRKRLGVKYNIEMVLLPREMFKQKNKLIKIYFGKPLVIDLNEKTAKNWTLEIRKIVYDLPSKMG